MNSDTMKTTIQKHNDGIECVMASGESIKLDRSTIYLEDEEQEDTDWNKTREVSLDKCEKDQEDIKDIDEIDINGYNRLIGAELVLPRGDNYERGIVKRRKLDIEGNPIGKYNANPILDSSIYEVIFPNGEIIELSGNAIAENIWTEIDIQGYRNEIMSSIVDHRQGNAALTKEEALIDGKYKPTTKGWDLLVEWKHGGMTWVPLREMKNSNPVEVAEYARDQEIEKEPAFVWWVAHTLRRKKILIKKAKTRYWRTTHKLGIKLPYSVEEALKLDKENGKKYWEMALAKETGNVKAAFELLAKDI